MTYAGSCAATGQTDRSPSATSTMEHGACSSVLPALSEPPCVEQRTAIDRDLRPKLALRWRAKHAIPAPTTTTQHCKLDVDTPALDGFPLRVPATAAHKSILDDNDRKDSRTSTATQTDEASDDSSVNILKMMHSLLVALGLPCCSHCRADTAASKLCLLANTELAELLASRRAPTEQQEQVTTTCGDASNACGLGLPCEAELPGEFSPLGSLAPVLGC